MSRYTGGGGYLPLTWWLAGSTIDLWFSQSKYFDSAVGDGVPVTNYLSISRASTGYAKNSSGTWISFGNDTLRITDLGLLIEGSRTNNLLNSEAPATQTTASLGTGSYTLWVEGSGSATPTGGTATITGGGAATAGSPNTFTVTVAGTVVVTVSGSLTRFQLEAGSWASSYILTTGATATRAQDSVTFAGTLTTLIQTMPNSLVIDLTAEVFPPDFWRIVGDTSSGNAYAYSPSDNTSVNQFNGTDVVSANFGGGRSYTLGAKIGTSRASGTGRSAVAGGGTVATDAFGPGTLTVPTLGESGSASQTWFGPFRRATFWNTRLADATLQGFTAP